MKTDRQQVGKQGEDEACTYLKSIGHTIVARNWRNAHLEIDIITLYGSEIHIVEVKSRTAPAAADPTVNVNLRKRNKLIAAANAFLHSPERIALSGREDLELFFDVVSVVFDQDGFSIEYYPKAFTPIYV